MYVCMVIIVHVYVEEAKVDINMGRVSEGRGRRAVAENLRVMYF